MLNVSLQLTHELAKVPTKGSDDAAGYDLYSTEEYELKPMERKLFNIRIKMSIPKGYYGRVAPKSGWALKSGMDVLAGVIDSDYRGEVGVLLVNLSTESIKISVGDKIAQMIFEQSNDAQFSVENTLEETQRGEGGFGSTGLTDEQRKVGTEMIKRGGDFIHPHKKDGGIEKPIFPPNTLHREGGSILDLFKKNPDQVEAKSYEKLVREREQNLK